MERKLTVPKLLVLEVVLEVDPKAKREPCVLTLTGKRSASRALQGMEHRNAEIAGGESRVLLKPIFREVG